MNLTVTRLTFPLSLGATAARRMQMLWSEEEKWRLWRQIWVALDYVLRIEELAGAPATFVSVGPGREETIVNV